MEEQVAVSAMKLQGVMHACTRTVKGRLQQDAAGMSGVAWQSGHTMSRNSRKSASGVCHPVRKDALLRLTYAVASFGPQRDALSTLRMLRS